MQPKRMGIHNLNAPVIVLLFVIHFCEPHTAHQDLRVALVTSKRFRNTFASTSSIYRSGLLHALSLHFTWYQTITNAPALAEFACYVLPRFVEISKQRLYGELKMNNIIYVSWTNTSSIIRRPLL